MHPGKNWRFFSRNHAPGSTGQDGEEADFALSGPAAGGDRLTYAAQAPAATAGGKLKFSRGKFPAPMSRLPRPRCRGERIPGPRTDTEAYTCLTPTPILATRLPSPGDPGRFPSQGARAKFPVQGAAGFSWAGQARSRATGNLAHVDSRSAKSAFCQRLRGSRSNSGEQAVLSRCSRKTGRLLRDRRRYNFFNLLRISAPSSPI